MTRPSYIPQTAYIRARVDGAVSGYFEWMGAASYTSDQRTSAMHGKQFLLDAVYAGRGCRFGVRAVWTSTMGFPRALTAWW